MPRATTTIAAGQVWEPKRGRLWARVERLVKGRVHLFKYAPDGDYSKCGAVTGPYTIDIAERSFRGDYKLSKSPVLAGEPDA